MKGISVEVENDRITIKGGTPDDPISMEDIEAELRKKYPELVVDKFFETPKIVFLGND